MILIWILFIVAQVIHVLLVARAEAQKDHTPWENVKDYLNANFNRLIVQFMLGAAIFGVLLENPTLLNDTTGMPLKMTKSLAVIFGWFTDSVVDKLLGKWGFKI